MDRNHCYHCGAMLVRSHILLICSSTLTATLAISNHCAIPFAIFPLCVPLCFTSISPIVTRCLISPLLFIVENSCMSFSNIANKRLCYIYFLVRFLSVQTTHINVLKKRVPVISSFFCICFEMAHDATSTLRCVLNIIRGSFFYLNINREMHVCQDCFRFLGVRFRSYYVLCDVNVLSNITF